MNRMTNSKIAWRVAFALAGVSLFAALALGGVSAWFLGAVALAGLGPAALTFNFHAPSAFVRLFAVTRTVAKYGERLAGHRAALADQIGHRLNIFGGLAARPQTLAAGWQLSQADRLADFLDDVEDVDYAKLRTLFPVVSLGVGAIALLLATAVIVPLAIVILLTGLLPLLLVKPLLSHLEQLEAERRATLRTASAQLGAVLGASVALEAEGHREREMALPQDGFAQQFGLETKIRAFLSVLEACLSIIGPFLGLGVFISAWIMGVRGEALLLPLLLGFAWLAMGEAMAQLGKAALGQVRAKFASEQMQDLTTVRASEAGPHTICELTFHDILPTSPTGVVLGAPLNLRVRRGQPLVFSGASGTGKTSLLKQIAGWRATEGRFECEEGRMLQATRRQSTHLALHDAVILSGSVRDNLFAPEARDEDLWEALRVVEMDTRVQTLGGLDAWVQQEHLSTGEAQRLNLARAVLSKKPIILLDEPNEHLGRDQAARILLRLCDHFQDRILILSTHRDVDFDCTRVQLRAGA